MTDTDPRPLLCRFRLIDEGKPYPRSSCVGCGLNILTGLGVACGEGLSPSMTVQEDMSVEPPTWAIQKAWEKCSGSKLPMPSLGDYTMVGQNILAFARYIAEHEEAPPVPVDPVLQAAREVYVEQAREKNVIPKEKWVTEVLNGEHDDYASINASIRSIKRYIELQGKADDST
jgi:hypothetical protein